MKIQTLLSYAFASPGHIDIPFDCTVVAMFVNSQMNDTGEFVIATANGQINSDSSKDGSTLLYGNTFSAEVAKPWVSFGPMTLLLPMRQHDRIYVRGSGADSVTVVLTVEVNRSV